MFTGRICRPPSRGWAVFIVCAVGLGAGFMAPAALGADIVVNSAGGDDFTSVQEAVDSVPSNNTQRRRILIKPGTYTQQLQVNSPHISLIGLGDKPEEVVLTCNLSAKSPKPGGPAEQTVGTTGSASTYINAPDFTAENLTFANSTPDNVAQAVAIKPQADRLAFRNCRFLGFQDTLYPCKGRQYYKDCYVTGDVDFIFGNGTAVFDHCTINSSDRGYVTAANTKLDTPHGFVFLDCTLTASGAAAEKPGQTYLGRPWQWDRGSNAAVAFIRTKMGPHIAPAGWHPWDVGKNTDPGANTRFAEYQSMDLAGQPLDTSQRVSWARQLSDAEAAEFTLDKIFSDWEPKTALDSH